MCRFALRLAARCLVIAIFTPGTAKADVSCTDDPENIMCQYLSNNKGSIQDRRGYYPQSRQQVDSVPGSMSLDMYSSPTFQSSLGSFSENDMPLWLFMGLGLDRRPETVALYHGPSGFAVTLAPSEVNLNEDKNVGNFASGSNQQIPKASKQLTQVVTAAAQTTGQKNNVWQFQAQQPMAVWPKNIKAYNNFQNDRLMPSSNSAPAQPVQGVRQPQSLVQAKRQGLGYQGNPIVKLTAGSMVPSSAGQPATSPNMRSSPKSKMNQGNQIVLNLATAGSLPFTKQPTYMPRFQQSFPVDSARNQKFGAASAEQKQYSPQGAYQQGTTNGLQTAPPMVTRQPVMPGQLTFQQPKRPAAVTAQTTASFSPSKAVAGPQGQLPGQQPPATIPQSPVPDQNGVAKTTLQQQFSSAQQALTGGSTKPVAQSTETLPAQQQQGAANPPQNSTQAPGITEQLGQAATAAPTNIAKQEGSLTASTATNESVASGTTAALQTTATQKQPTEQQQTSKTPGITSR